ncbi:MAG: hypothetical protein WBQ14_10115 [Gaiellaceae bacterium]
MKIAGRRLVATLAFAVALVAVAVVLAAHASGRTTHARLAGARAAVAPKGDILAAGTNRRLIVLDQNGRVLRRLPWWHAPNGFGLEGLELAPDRRHAFISLDNGDLPTRLYEVNLADGRKRLLAHATSPALSPDGSRLLFLTNRMSKKLGFPLLTALVVRNLSSGRQRVIPFRSRLTIGNPPELVTNWSPDGRHAILLDDMHPVLRGGDRLRLVDTATARSVDSQPALGGHLLAPVFLDAHRLVVLANCCIGRQRLVTVDLLSGKQAPFVQISSPVVSIRRYGPGRLLVADQLGQLLLVSRGHSTIIAGGIGAAAA